MSAASPPPPPPGWQQVPDPTPPAARRGLLDRVFRSDGGRRFVVVLTLVNTILASLVAGLQVAAGQRADDANRESQRLAIVTSGLVQSTGRQTTYEIDLLAEIATTSQDAIVHGLSALELNEQGDVAAARELQERSAVADARAERLRSLSTLFTDPRYAPASEGDLPDPQRFLDDQFVAANASVAAQNAAADDYAAWDGKSSAYVAVLTILALAFFLLGVGQVGARMRPFLALSASALMTVSVAWSALITWG